MLRDGSSCYLFLFDLSKSSGDDVVMAGEATTDSSFALSEAVKSVTWLDTGEPVPFSQQDGRVTVHPTPQRYGQSFVVRVAKITL